MTKEPERSTSASERAFADHMRRVAPDSTRGHGKGTMTDKTIIRLFIESYEDWCAAAQWAKANPKDVEASPKDRIRDARSTNERWLTDAYKVS